MRFSYRDVRASYSSEKAAQEKHDVMFRWFARPLSFPIAWLALRLGLAPNHVTYLSLAGNCAALVMLASGRRSLMAAGVAVALASLVLDAADGNMARTARRFSLLGEWLEGVGAYVLYAGFHLAGGIGAWLSVVNGESVVAWVGRSNWSGALVVLGAVASMSITLAALIAAKFAFVFPGVDRNKLVAKKGAGWYGALFTIGKNLSAPHGLVLPLTLVAIIVGRYELILGFYAIVNSAALLIFVWRCLVLAVRSGTVESAQ